MKSIRQKRARARASPLPDFRRLGVLLRLTLLVNVGALLGGLAYAGGWKAAGPALLDLAAYVEPPLLLCLASLYLAQPWLARLPPASAWAVIAVFAAAYALLPAYALSQIAVAEPGYLLFWALAACLLAWAYFDWRTRALSPALAEARLLALTARIRPHFLFNSINAVLGVIRSDARRAESALEEMADLFRVLMRENTELVRLADELELCRQYLALEQLRLGERLIVRWQVDAALSAALVPPLVLQPLLENAVYHGVEPAPGAAEIQVRVARSNGNLLLEVANPVFPKAQSVAGNRMALDNIRERLELFFDLEAQLETDQGEEHYHVRMRIPFLR
ncbi:MAG: histidine kinase [Rhodocyclaceae bacterium]|nr:histidine kinase [Rhodocyclaceae bacterium]MBX3667612.1 histidine kinase [Rhodocyclaceae bacterium]